MADESAGEGWAEAESGVAAVESDGRLSGESGRRVAEESEADVAGVADESDAVESEGGDCSSFCPVESDSGDLFMRSVVSWAT